jgi:TatD DNase family protein
VERVQFFDAHNHLADPEFDDSRREVLSECADLGIVCVVNSARPSDWPRVSDLAATNPAMIPCFGVHPWFLHEGSEGALRSLRDLLLARPSAVGEIGLDYSRTEIDREDQIRLFARQLTLAAEFNRSVSIHCVKAWGDMLTVLRESARPQVGFLLHSYSGPIELVAPLARLGAYFSFSESSVPAYEKSQVGIRGRPMALLQQIPRDRLLLETDAPGRRSNKGGVYPIRPSSVVPLYRQMAMVLGEEPEKLQAELNDNGQRLFEPINQGVSGSS